MSQRHLDLVFLGLSLSSSWGNGHATTYRALLRGLAERGHRSLFLERDVPGYAAARDLPRPDFCDLELYHDIADLPVRFGERIATADAVVVGSYVPDGIAVTIHQLPWPRWNRTVVPISPHGNRRSSISIFPSPADPYWGIWPIASACVGPARSTAPWMPHCIGHRTYSLPGISAISAPMRATGNRRWSGCYWSRPVG